MVTYKGICRGLDVHRALAEGDDVCNGGFGTFVASGGAVWQVLHKPGTDPTFVDPYLASLSGGCLPMTSMTCSNSAAARTVGW